MELKCSLCKRPIDAEKDHAIFFQCYVYCEKCLEEMEGKGPTRIRREAKKESTPGDTY
jgi:hypothetical protein